MRLGCCVDPDMAASAADAGYDFAELPVAAVRAEEPEAVFASARDAMLAAPAKPEAWRLLLPPDLKVAGPDVDWPRVARYIYTSLRRIASIIRSLEGILTISVSGLLLEGREPFDLPMLVHHGHHVLPRPVPTYVRHHRQEKPSLSEQIVRIPNRPAHVRLFTHSHVERAARARPEGLRRMKGAGDRPEILLLRGDEALERREIAEAEAFYERVLEQRPDLESGVFEIQDAEFATQTGKR